MEKIKLIHRKSLKKINPIITHQNWKNSKDNYGLPAHAYPKINLPLNDEITYTDLIAFLSTHLNKSVKYIEIGVSVLKSFFQLCNSLNESTLYAFDHNDINPTVEKHFKSIQITERIKKYTYNTNKLIYFKGDVFKKVDWEDFAKCINSKVNVIFSDAHHTYEGLMSEYNNLINNILDEEFILYYDDLAGGVNYMDKAFRTIAKLEKNKNSNITCAYVYVRGWNGQHEHIHCNGIITTLNLRKILDKTNIKIKYLY